MAKLAVPQHKAALYFNELAPMRGKEDRCAFFGHFYHLPDPDAVLTRPIVALPNAGWGVVNDNDVNDVVCGGLYFERDGKRSLFAVFRSGETYIYQGTERRAIRKPPGVGFLSGLGMVADTPYTCGSQNAVYKFNGKIWVDVAGSMRIAYGGPADPILSAIDGFAESDIYAVGYNGSIVHFDGSLWREIDSPTNQHLYQLVCHKDGQVYACGRDGTIIRGRANDWEDLSSSQCKEDLWGIASFDGDVFLCTYRRLFRIVNGNLIEVVVPANSAASFYRLGSNRTFLWATTGTGRILRFDKQNWVELVWPDSV